MSSRRGLKKKDKIIIAVIALVSVLSASLIIGFVSAKYVSGRTFSGRITVSGKLADSIEIFEHKAERQPDGSYRLGSAEVSANSYVLMPGVDVPKDPTVRIKGYTGMPATVFVEVTGALPDTVKYVMADGWQALDGRTGVYYRDLDENQTGDIVLQVLKGTGDSGCQLVVSQELSRETSVTLSFQAYIAQKTDGGNIADAFDAAKE